jgi:hypothetical protein
MLGFLVGLLKEMVVEEALGEVNLGLTHVLEVAAAADEAMVLSVLVNLKKWHF